MAKSGSGPKDPSSTQRNLPLNHRLMVSPAAYEIKTNDLVTAPAEMGSPTLTVHNPRVVQAAGLAEGVSTATGVAAIIEAPDVVEASGTATTSARLVNMRRRIAVVREIGPSADSLVTSLLRHIEADRLNAPEAKEALNALRELHRVLGEVIAQADSGELPPQALHPLKKAERHVDKALKAAGFYARYIGETAILAVVISAIFKTPVDNTLIAGVLQSMGQVKFAQIFKR